jgi:hypothetical protein
MIQIVKKKYDIGDPNGKPFICQINPEGCVVLSCLIYAKDEDDAKSKIREIIEYSKIDNKNYLGNLNDYWKQYADFYTSKIEMIEYYMSILEVFPADVTKAFKIGWASNDTLL